MSEETCVPASAEPVVGESRWPMASAVLIVIALTFALPRSLIVRPRAATPIVEAMLLFLVIIRDPGRIDRLSKPVRAASRALISLLLLSTLVCTAQLIAQLVRGGAAANSASALLTAGGIVWVSNCITFGLLYWEFDSGGPAARAHGLPEHPDFAFPQQLSPELAPQDWRPRYVDYLYLGFTNSIAFSPTDVLPMRRWNKLAMMGQAAISLALLGLVIARAVNVLR